jgi:hypothetical protein
MTPLPFPHPDYPEIPEMVLRIAHRMGGDAWAEQYRLKERDKWIKCQRKREWSLECARDVLRMLLLPTEDMVSAGAWVISREYDTDSPRQDALSVFLAMVEKTLRR